MSSRHQQSQNNSIKNYICIQRHIFTTHSIHIELGQCQRNNNEFILSENSFGNHKDYTMVFRLTNIITT